MKNGKYTKKLEKIYIIFLIAVMLKTSRNDEGYRYVEINGKKHMVHIMVAKKFIPNINNYPIVNHKDGNKENNGMLNLEWFTSKLNAQHAVDTGLRTDLKKVVHYDNDNNILGIYTSCVSAGKALNVNGKLVHDYCNNKVKQCHGMKLKVKYLAPTDDIVYKKIDPDTIPITDGVSLRKRKVIQYDEQHNILNIFDSVIETSKKLGIGITTVKDCCNGSREKNHNKNIRIKYLSQTDDIINKKIDPETIPKYNKINKRLTRVVQYNDKYEILNIFKSIVEASQKFNISTSSVKNCCSGKIKSCTKNNIKLKRLSETDDIINKKIDPTTIPYLSDTKQTKVNLCDRKITIYKKETNEFVETLDNMVQVSEKYNLSVKSLYKHCDGSVKHSKCKYLFKYHEETT
ncbi:HNH endonuclease [Klosneuvirus KNV1]|uniref:HNH endonuclease n=1 Tax=Klosneuvirus KNV1 TaxID=1977640 RepID=A0A1V0SHN1_9VIRU|nr:HNH endonuclease [Klosneuvirus KNV1]